MASILEFLQSRNGGDWVWLLSLPLIVSVLIWWPLLHYRIATWRLERKLAQRDVLFADERIELAMSVPEKPEPLSWKTGVLGALALALFWFALEFVQWRGISAIWVLGPLFTWVIAREIFLWRQEGMRTDGVPPHVPRSVVLAVLAAGGIFLVTVLAAVALLS